MERQNSTCGLEEAVYYKAITKSHLSVWHKFVPNQNQMTPSNCWLSKKITLPKELLNKLKDVATFVDIQHQFSQEELKNVLSLIFEDGNKTLYSSSHSKQYFCLPSIFLIGFPKCGTTLLYKYIESHPLMAKPHNKEGQFWREFVKPRDTKYRELQTLIYLFHFYAASQQIQIHPGMFTLDASASTVFATSQPHIDLEKDTCIVPELLFDTLPNSKLLIILRNPIDRLWSDFWYFCSRSQWRNHSFQIMVPEKVLPIASEIFHNLTVLAVQEFVNCINNHNTEFHCVTLVGSFSGEEAGCEKVRLGLSIYYIHILRWFSVFPRNQFLLLRLEDLVANSVKSMKRIWSFLTVSNNITVIKSRQNSNDWINRSEYRGHFTMWKKTRNLLKDFFHPYNLKLTELLDDQRYLWKEL